MKRDYLVRTRVGRTILNIEYRLILFTFYVGFLGYLLIKGSGWAAVFYTHVSFVVIYSIFYFGRQFFYILAAPIVAIVLPIHNLFLKKYLKKFKQNTPAEVTIVLAHSDWRKLEAWVKPNFFINEIAILIKYLKTNKQDFSFYPNATIEGVEKIMQSKTVKEVYFFGHGSSHVFQLGTDDILYYCEFNHERYGKEFVHQVHCGTKDGKSLVDYVVPENNRSKCFLIRKSISGLDIVKEFKKKIKEKTAA